MIKRDGAAIVNAKTKATSVANETLDILKQKQYKNII